MKKILRKIIPTWLLSLYHFLLAYIGATAYRFPGRRMITIGVTGTNGKSTVVELLHAIFTEFGFRVASFSSLRFRIRDEVIPAKPKMTMPGRFFLQKLLNQALKTGCQLVIIEVTSEGIKQHRHRGIGFEAAVITNLRPEHIEAHGSFEAYRAAKGKLFDCAQKIIVNLDDPSAFYFLHFTADIKIGYGLLRENERADVVSVIPERVSFSAGGINFSYGGLDWQSRLAGDFNLYNILAAIAVANSFKIPLEYVRNGVKNVKGVPGRLEIVREEPFRIIVDYAHTPDALEAVYRISRSLWIGNSKRLIVVLGAAGGGRDRWKRPELGKIAERFADKIYLTNEDPYDENPEQIIEEIKSKMTEKKHEVVLDRKEAVKKALLEAQKGDVVLITGKGAEQAMAVKGGLIPWDDREVVRNALRANPKSQIPNSNEAPNSKFKTFGS